MMEKLAKPNPLNAERVTPDLSYTQVEDPGMMETAVQGGELVDSVASNVGAGANLYNLLNASPTAARITGVAAKFEPLLALLQGVDLARVAGDPSYRQESINAVDQMGGGDRAFSPSAAFQAMGRAPATIYGLGGAAGEAYGQNAMNEATQQGYDQDNFYRQMQQQQAAQQRANPRLRQQTTDQQGRPNGPLY
jgi:hypothetical protein